MTLAPPITDRVAWLTHHLPVDDTGGGKWLPGRFRGGAEMSDWEYQQAAPAGVAIDVYAPDEWEQTLDYDRIVITGTDQLSDVAMIELAHRRPMVFLHHEQTESGARQALLNAAFPLVLHTPAHLHLELQWVEPEYTGLVLSHFDTSECREVKKQPFALWAARNHPLKGLNQARVWAHGAGFPLVVMHDHPRADVLEFMSRAEAFVHLPLCFESEGRAVMEAVLSGCRVQTNTNVGITSVEGWQDRGYLKHLVDTAGEQFWDFVLCQ